jgi:hypothetical protein
MIPPVRRHLPPGVTEIAIESGGTLAHTRIGADSVAPDGCRADDTTLALM